MAQGCLLERPKWPHLTLSSVPGGHEAYVIVGDSAEGPLCVIVGASAEDQVDDMPPTAKVAGVSMEHATPAEMER